MLGTGSQYNNTYTVKLTIGGISDNFNVTTVSMVSNIERLSDAGLLSFYPNPTTGLVRIAGIEDGGLLEVYNVAGQLVKSEKVNSASNYQLNLLPFEPGMYMVKFDTAAKAYHGQIIVRSK
jgi:hypothetical protein